MSVPPIPRVLISVQPRLLGSMMANILDHLAVDEVANLDTGTVIIADTDFDGAVISGVLSDGVTAKVIIELPDREGNAGMGRVLSRNLAESVLIGGFGDVLGLLDRHCPGSIRRLSNG